MNEAARGHGPAGARSAGAARITRSREPASVLGDHRAMLDGIGAVVFDFDGTLADTTPSHEQALRAALQPHGLDLDPGWYLRHAGLSIRDLLAQLPGARHLPHDEIIQHSRTRLLATIGCITPIGGVVTLLRAARRAGLPCAIASGASRLLVQPRPRSSRPYERVRGSRHGRRRTARQAGPDLYIEAARRLDVPPSRCLAIDDAPDGMTAARAAGMHVLTLTGGHLAPADGGGDQTGQTRARRLPAKWRPRPARRPATCCAGPCVSRPGKPRR